MAQVIRSLQSRSGLAHTAMSEVPDRIQIAVAPVEAAIDALAGDLDRLLVVAERRPAVVPMPESGDGSADTGRGLSLEPALVAPPPPVQLVEPADRQPAPGARPLQ
jgi:hypothetical protein